MTRHLGIDAQQSPFTRSPRGEPGLTHGGAFRDLNHNGRMDPYEDPARAVEDRVDDLLAQLSLPEKVGLMFHTDIEAGPDGALMTGAGRISTSATSSAVLDRYLTHVNVHALHDARTAAAWHNGVQRLAERTPHGIPVTISSNPRHGFVPNLGASLTAGPFSQWPAPLGLAALADPDLVRYFADVVRQEYCAVGIRAALHPTLDLATEPRWARQVDTFGQDPILVAQLGAAYLHGMQLDSLQVGSVACTIKHFPGGGPRRGGDDAHFPYGRDLVYPDDRFAEHLAPFVLALEVGAPAVMPYYGRPLGLELDGEPVEAVGFGYNRQVVTGLLRDQLGYEGVVLTDWGLIHDNHVGAQVLPARAWGMEHLDPSARLEAVLEAGADQIGGEECVELLIDLVASGRIAPSRIDVSARRLLDVKFRLGLFDDPFVDVAAAPKTVGRADFVHAGRLAQAASVTPLVVGRLPLHPGMAVYAENVDPDVLAERFTVAPSLEQAEVALVRLQAPFEPRSELLLEADFHQGSLDFPPGLLQRMRHISQRCPLIIDVHLDRPAVLTSLLDVVTTLTASYGTSDGCLLDALTGAVPPRGRLPFDLPRSMGQVREHPEDRPGYDDPLFTRGYG